MNSSVNVSASGFAQPPAPNIAKVILSSAWFYQISVALGLVGLVLNAAIIAMAVHSRHIHGDYKNFIANLALMDLMAAAIGTAIAAQMIYPEVIPATAAFIFIEGFFGYYSVMMMVAALFPIVLSRYFIVQFAHMQLYERFFTRRLCIAYCIGLDVLPLPLVALMIFDSRVKKAAIVAFWALVLLLIAVILLLGYLTHRSVRRHVAAAQSLQQQRRNKEAAELLKATMLQTAVPIVCQSPLFCLLFLFLVLQGNRFGRSGNNRFG